MPHDEWVSWFRTQVYIVRYDNDGQKQGWFCISVNESFITEHVCDFAYLHNGISYTDKTTFLY